jgi:hypothetical protein
MLSRYVAFANWNGSVVRDALCDALWRTTPWQVADTRHNYPPDNASACNIDDVREGSASSRHRMLSGPHLTRDSKGAAVMHRSPGQDCAIPPGNSVVNIPDRY